MNQTERSARTRALQAALTAANGGVAPIDVHNRTTYVDWKCRCTPCSDDHREQLREQKESRYARTAANGGVAPIDVHNASTYKNWNCRCDPCTIDNTKKGNERSARLREQRRAS